MSTAYELLATEECDDILVVDLESRKINIPGNVSVLGVESDDETRVLHFQLPRYYCDVDLSEFAIRINYKNANGEGDMYIVSESVLEGDLIKFDWVVGRHAYVKKGNVTFSVCLKEFNEEVVTREFNTTIATLPVLEGLETGESIVREHLDIFEQLREDLTSNITFFGDNPTGGVDNDTVDTWLGLGCGFAWISESNQVNDQPSQYGFIINYAHHMDVFQIFQNQMDGNTYLRCGDRNSSWFRSWSRIPTIDSDGSLNIGGNIQGNYLMGERIRTMSDTHLTSSASKVAVLDDEGWVYHRTPDEIRSDINVYSKSEVDKAIAEAIAKAIG